MTGSPANALVFGAGGQIGGACRRVLERQCYSVVGTGRAAREDAGIVAFDPLAGDILPGTQAFDAVVWAQGANLNDSLADFDADRHLDLYKANALFVAQSLHRLLAEQRLNHGARLCVVSSVWQRVARRQKLSYMMSKAALQGLVMSAAIDLAEQGMMINAVLPGALDTPMTHANLSAEQIARIAAMTPFGRLASIDDVANIVGFLCAAANTSITGQFIAVDMGFENARIV